MSNLNWTRLTIHIKNLIILILLICNGGLGAHEVAWECGIPESDSVHDSKVEVHGDTLSSYRTCEWVYIVSHDYSSSSCTYWMSSLNWTRLKMSILSNGSCKHLITFWISNQYKRVTCLKIVCNYCNNRLICTWWPCIEFSWKPQYPWLNEASKFESNNKGEIEWEQSRSIFVFSFLWRNNLANQVQRSVCLGPDVVNYNNQTMRDQISRPI